MRSFTFDIETDGLLDHMTHIKCLNMVDLATGERLRFTDEEFYRDARTGALTAKRTKRNGTIEDGLVLLATAHELSGQNIEGFDLPALHKVRGFRYRGKTFDTKTVSLLLYPDMKERDQAAIMKGKLVMPGNLIGTHKLESWGYRLGKELKGEFKPSDFGDWTWNNYPFSEECDDYCLQDCVANVELVNHLRKRCVELGVPDSCLDLEHQVAAIIARQEVYGWLFDSAAAEKLTAELLGEKADLELRLTTAFGEFYLRDGTKSAITKKDRKVWIEHELGAQTRKVKGVVQRGYYSYFTQNIAHTKVKLVLFNPGSRAHIAHRLKAMYGWEPAEFTNDGKAKVDESILGQLPYDESKLLTEFFAITKMLGQVSEGKNAFLKCVRADGRIHGSVNTCGAVTRRMTHSKPNVAQADKDARVRSLFKSKPGYKLVGTDADALELRCLAHRLAKYDGGEYITVVLDGKKEDGTDMHSRNQRSTGLAKRDTAKTIFYAWLYGAGDYKLGLIVYSLDWDDDKKSRFNARFQGEARNSALSRIGKRIRDGLVDGITGADELIDAVKHRAKTRGYVKGLDGGRIQCRSQHAALNTLLQSDGALVMKKALCIADADLQASGLVPGVDYEWVGNIHDEFQAEVKIEHAEFVGRIVADSIRKSGEHFKFRCPLAGNFDIGETWADTH
jgi:DNA polymerase-1